MKFIYKIFVLVLLEIQMLLKILKMKLASFQTWLEILLKLRKAKENSKIHPLLVNYSLKF